MKILSALVLAIFASACSPSYPPPEGFVDACYGGDWQENMVGLSPVYSADLNITDENAVDFRKVFADVADGFPVEHFDVGDKFGGVRPIDIDICSENGLFISAIKLGHSTGTEEVMIDVFVYKPDYEWQPIVESIESAINARWPDQLDTSPTRTTNLRKSPM